MTNNNTLVSGDLYVHRTGILKNNSDNFTHKAPHEVPGLVWTMTIAGRRREGGTEDGGQQAERNGKRRAGERREGGRKAFGIPVPLTCRSTVLISRVTSITYST